MTVATVLAEVMICGLCHDGSLAQLVVYFGVAARFLLSRQVGSSRYI